ncbi:MAG: prolyl oligopeptidase family serine peptidase, partial [Sphingomonadales bacterium]
MLGSTAVQAAPPVAAYGQLPTLGDLALSPDGTRYAAIMGDGEGAKMLVRTIADGALVAGAPAGKNKLRDVRWAGNDFLVLTMSQFAQTMSQDPNYVFTGKGEQEFALIYSFAKKAWVRTLQNLKLTSNTILAPPTIIEKDGQPQLIARGYSIPSTTFLSTVFRINPASNQTVTTELGMPGTRNWLIDRDGVAQAQSVYDQQSGKWKVMARRPVGWAEVYSEVAQLDSPAMRLWGKTPGTVIIQSHKSGKWENYELALADGTLSAPKPEYDGDGLLARHGTMEAIGTVNIGTETVTYDFWDANDARLWRGISRAFPGALVTLADWTPDRMTVAVNVFGPQYGDAVYIVDRKAKTANVLGPRYAGIPATDIAPVQYITYKAADGMEIGAYLTLPLNRPAKGLPLIVLPHGGPEARDEPGFDWWPQALASRGYAVLQPQFRGSDGFGEALRTAGYGQWGKAMQTDLSDGVKHLAAAGTIDPKRVCIAGASYGGYAAMAGVTVQQGVYRCASAVAGVSDLGKMLASEIRDAGDSRTEGVRYWKRFMGTESASDPAL